MLHYELSLLAIISKLFHILPLPFPRTATRTRTGKGTGTRTFPNPIKLKASVTFNSRLKHSRWQKANKFALHLRNLITQSSARERERDEDKDRESLTKGNSISQSASPPSPSPSPSPSPRPFADRPSSRCTRHVSFSAKRFERLNASPMQSCSAC